MNADAGMKKKGVRLHRIGGLPEDEWMSMDVGVEGVWFPGGWMVESRC